MKKSSTTFLQVVIALVGISTLVLMLWEPHLEGRNVGASLYQIYFNDPFLAYVYVASIAFFAALYQGFKLLGYIGENKVFSQGAVKALRNIKYCAVALGVLIVGAGAYIKAFHSTGDDPAGFLAMCIVATFASIVTASVAAVFERTLQNAVDTKSENDLTV